MFIVTFMDNVKLDALFNQSSSCYDEVNNEIVYYMKREHDSTHFGNKLRIVLGGGMSNVLSQGSDEFIIDFDFFVAQMKEHNYHVVEAALFESFKQSQDLTDIEQDISHLNRYCVFQKGANLSSPPMPFQDIHLEKSNIDATFEFKSIQLQNQKLSLHKVSTKYDIIDVEDIWPYLIKQIKTPEGFINDTSDPIAKYHQLLTKNLDTKYQNLERNVLDRDMINRENRKLEDDMA